MNPRLTVTQEGGVVFLQVTDGKQAMTIRFDEPEAAEKAADQLRIAARFARRQS